MNTISSGNQETKCAMCGKTISQTTQVLTETIDGNNYTFDNKDCALFFKRFKSLYGGSFNA